MSTLGSTLRRAAGLFVEPAARPPPALAVPLDVVVTGLGAGAGATTVSRGLAQALRRVRPVELSSASGFDAVAPGPGTAVVRDTAPAEVGRLRPGGPGRVLLAVADARREPALAALVHGVLARRHERVVLVANRARDPDAWRAAGAVCLPESRAGAWLLGRGRRAPGALGAAFDALAAAVERAL